MSSALAFDYLTRGEIDELKELLEEVPTLMQARNPGKISLFMSSLYHQQTDLAQWLVHRGLELDPFEAAAFGDWQVLDEVPRKALNSLSADGFSPLHLAAFFGHTEAVRSLLKRGADPHRVAENPTWVQPLHSAVAGGELSVVEHLLEAGADANARQQLGFTPLMGAASSGKRAIVDLLLRHGARREDPNEAGFTAFDLAVQRGHDEVANRVRIT